MGYQNMSTAFVYKQPLFATKLDALGENDAYLKNNNFPDGTKAVFFQASAPTGWSQDTGNNDALLRVVSGVGGGTGGTQSISANLSLNHLHTLTAQGTHTHIVQNHNHQVGVSSTGGYASATATDRLVGVGNTVMRFYRADGAGTTQTRSQTLTEVTIAAGGGASSASGNHNHTLTSSLTDTNFAYVDIIIASKNANSGYTDVTTDFSHNDKAIFDTMALLEDNDEYLTNRIPVFGSKMVFFQAAAPTGWTQATTVNDKALRIVSGAGIGTGGAQAIGTPLDLTHAHTASSVAGHNHVTATHQHDLASAGTDTMKPVSDFLAKYYASKTGAYWKITDGTAVTRTVYKGRTALDGSVTSSTSTAHNNPIVSDTSTFQLAYMDVIEASKNSGGAPFAYQDLTGDSIYKGLVSKQKLNAHGENDAYLKYHTIPATSNAIFFQATAPLTWTQSVAQNDKCLRIVTGAGGGTGGSDLISVGLGLAHTHTVNNSSHSHLMPHSHVFDTVSQSNSGADAAGLGPIRKASTFFQDSSAFASTIDAIIDTFDSNNTSIVDNPNHNHGGTSQSALTNTVLKYIDTILCAKD